MEWVSLQPYDHLRAAVLPSGVPVLWSPAEGVTTARLMFRVGVLDERLVDRGLTHLVEHLAHTDLGLTSHPSNASVGRSWTQFDVRGEPEQVDHHLMTLTRALANIPLGRLAAEIEVLKLEAQREGADPWLSLRQHRYGIQGPALNGYQEIAVLRDDATSVAGAQRVHEWARRYFTASNAVLWVHGPQPRPLHLELPGGTPPPRADLTVPARSGPAWFSDDPGVVAFSAVAPDGPAALAAWWWLHHQLRQRLRFQDAAVYDVDGNVDPLGVDHLELFLAARTTADRAGAVLAAVQEVVATTCAGEVPEQELAEWARELIETHEEPGVLDAPQVMRQLDAVAGAMLRQPVVARDPRAAVAEVRQRLELRRQGARQLTPARVRQELVAMMATSLLQVPQGVPGPVELPALSPLSAHGLRTDGGDRSVRTYVPARHLPAGQRLVVSAEGVMHEAAPGVMKTVLWSRCIAVLVLADGTREVLSEEGVGVTVDPSVWDQGGEAAAVVDACAPPGVVVAMTGGEQVQRAAPQVLTGLAARSTQLLIFVITFSAILTVAFAATAGQTSRPEIGWALSAGFGAVLVWFVIALVRRTRVPAQQRLVARSSAGMAVERALARGSRGTALGVAIGLWALAAVVLVTLLIHGMTLWPVVVVIGLAIRATVEFNRRTLR